MSQDRARPAVRAFSTPRHARRAVTPGFLSQSEREAAASLVSSLREGSRLALAKLLTQVENDTPVGRAALSLLFKDTGRAHLIGITGSPGTGKSSLVNRIAQYYRRPPEGMQPQKVAVIAVDPSSPFSGGAVLGDRVRMRDLAGDTGVFIRSMASRGALGGLSHTTAAAVQVLDAAGFDVVLIETVGAGQSEVDIARVAHTTLVVEAPGLGDDIQAIKAGILEIADILVVNKADRPGVENTERALRNMLEMAHPQRSIYHRAGRDELVTEMHLTRAGRAPSMAAGETPEELNPTWMPRVIRTIATEGVGMEELGKAIACHHDYLLSSGEWAYREQLRIQSELDALLRDTLVSRWRASITDRDIRRALDELLHRRITPFEAVERLTGGPPFTGSLRTQE